MSQTQNFKYCSGHIKNVMKLISVLYLIQQTHNTIIISTRNMYTASSKFRMHYTLKAHLNSD